MLSGSSSSRVLVIGLDMGDGALVRHWTNQGRLPHLGELTSSGMWCDLETTAEALHTSVWPTFATGTLPGRHGVYYPYQPTPGRQLARHIAPDQYGAPTFWKIADEAGKRCLVYDVPETFPERGFRGRAVFDWGTWAWYGEPTTQPSPLERQLRARFGAYPLGFEAKRLGFGHPDHLEQRLLRSIQYKASSAKWLLESDPWDLAIVAFCETHPGGHYLWPAGADSVNDPDAASFQGLLNVYAEIDKAVGTLRNDLPRDAALLVVSGDGVRPNRCGWHLLPAALQRLGYLHGPVQANGQAAATSSSSNAIASRVLAATKRQIAAALPWHVRDRIGIWLQARSIDWSRTRAFALPTDLEGCVRLNVKGREPFGIVEPGAQYGELCQEIRARLEELVNPSTGASAVNRVWIRNEVFPGPRQEELPDLIVTWNDDAPITALESPRFGRIDGVNLDPRPGTHSTRGFLIASGAGIERSARCRGRLVDVAPSALQMLGVMPPQTMDGTALGLLTRAPASGPATREASA
jgi:predicted AlkP superfamily phosphohydrolase/phosphomutase